MTDKLNSQIETKVSDYKSLSDSLYRLKIEKDSKIE